MYIPFAIFVAYGVVYLQKYATKFNGLLIGAILLILFENLQGFPYDTRSVVFTNSYSRESSYAKLVSGKVTVHSPLVYFDQRVAGRYLNMAVLSGERTVSGYSGYYPQDWARLGLEVDNTYSEAALKKIVALGADYLIVHTDLLGDVQKPVYLSRSEWLSQGVVFKDDRLVVYDLKKLPISAQRCTNSQIKIIGIAGYKKVVENTENCYFTYPFEQRYVNSVGVRMPLVVAPAEKYIVPLD